jgi:hypothetical protein
MIHAHSVIVSSVVLYGFKTLSIILMEEQILMQTENRVLRKIFGSGRVEVTEHVPNVRSGLILLEGKLHLQEGGRGGRAILT